MKKILISLLIVFLTSTAGFTQLQLNLSGNWPDDMQVKLYAFDGIYSQVVKSDFHPPGTYNFELAEPDVEAMYLLQLSDSIALIYETRVIYTAGKLNFKLVLGDQELETIWHSGNENDIYSEFIKRRDKMLKRFQSLRSLYAYYPDTESEFYQNLGKSFNKQSYKLDSLFEYYSLNQKNDVLGSYINAGRINIPPLSYSLSDQIDDMVKHFFDYYDPLDTVLIKSPLYKEKLDEYLELIMSKASANGEFDEDIVINALDAYINKIKDDETLFEASLQYIWEYLYKKELESVCKYLDINYLSESCLAEDNDQLKERLLAYERLAVGAMAPDITWTDNEGDKSLSQLKGKPTLIVFWASWCPHCTNLLPGVHDYFKNNPDVNILAVGLDEDAQAWSNAVSRYPLWSHMRASEKWDSPSARDYAIYATPTFYIIDNEGIILGKAKTLSEIVEYFPSGQ